MERRHFISIIEGLTMFPLLLKLGYLQVYASGIFVALGIIFCVFFIWRQARGFGVNEEKVLDSFVMGLFGLVLGGRLSYGLTHWDFFGKDFVRLVFFTKYPGFSWSGGIAIGFLAAVLASWSLGLSVWAMMDIFAMGLSVALVFGYFGCFATGCMPGQTYLPLILFAVALFSVACLMFIRAKMKNSLSWQEFSKRPGLVFLSYLIFSCIYLLMLARYQKTDGRIWGLGLSATISIFIVRYYSFFRKWSHFLKQFWGKLQNILRIGGAN